VSTGRCPGIVRISDRTDKRGRIPDARRCSLLRSGPRLIGPGLDTGGGMSLPRQVLPGQFYLVTRRYMQRQFMLRPDTETNNAFTYCLIEAAQRCQIEVILPPVLAV